MNSYAIRRASNRGKGVFATKTIKKNEVILCVNISNLKRYTPKEIANDPKLDGDHSDYAGYGEYVIDHSPGSYINHSCNPNCFVRMKSIVKKHLVAMRDIHKGEELTVDYQAIATDQFAGKGFWTMKCKCRSKNCRKKITGDFFKLPKSLQRKYYPNLPPSVKQKFKDKFGKIMRRK